MLQIKHQIYISNRDRLVQQIRKHFQSPGRNGFLNDVSITFIDKTDFSDPLKREDYWRRTLKTMAPFRLNIEDNCLISYSGD